MARCHTAEIESQNSADEEQRRKSGHPRAEIAALGTERQHGEANRKGNGVFDHLGWQAHRVTGAKRLHIHQVHGRNGNADNHPAKRGANPVFVIGRDPQPKVGAGKGNEQRRHRHQRIIGSPHLGQHGQQSHKMRAPDRSGGNDGGQEHPGVSGHPLRGNGLPEQPHDR